MTFRKIVYMGIGLAMASGSPVQTKALTGLKDEISFYVLVKSANYAQDAEGTLKFLNNHMFSEIFIGEGVTLTGAQLTRPDAPDQPINYVRREKTYYVEGGHFDSEAELDQAYPNGTFTFDIQLPNRDIRSEMLLAGPEGETDIPDPIVISLYQDGQKMRADALDPGKKLTVRWSAYSNGRSDPKGIVDDMIFVVMADCHGERIIHTGLPFQGPYTKYTETEISVDAAFLKTGHPYSMFVEFPHVVDSNITDGVPGFTSFATATYLDVKTLGPDTSASCPADKIPMDTGQTDRMEDDAVQ
ncbi:hypothetical protein [Paremcibacter congregatus]|uniref:hypothetical protein n=1 Tax=Paremcibacter congregatus TaxID=2043170 RepID=UPI003A91C7ED